MSVFDIQMDGLNELIRRLGDLALEEQEENQAINAGLKVIQKAVKNERPYDDGTIDKNIKIQRAKNGEGRVHTGKAYHAHIIEFGRSAGSKYVLKNGKQQKVTWGAIAANPFFTRAFNKSIDDAKQAIIDEVKKVKNL